MEEKYDNNSRQVLKEELNSNSLSGSSSKHRTEASENNNQNTTDLDMKRASLSRSSTLESIQEEDSELEEKDMLESFKSITDVFENGYEEEKTSSTKPSPAATSLTSKSASLSISEDTDSLDEEVRQIMFRSEEKRLQQSHEATNQVAINSLKPADETEGTKITKDEEETKSYDEKLKEEEKEEEEEEILEEYDYIGVEWDRESSVPTDTESISESDPDSELESLSEDEKTGHWTPRDGDSSDDEEFDLEEHINKLCSHTLYSDSSSESENSDSEAQEQKAINKVMKMYKKKYAQDEESETSNDSYDDDDSDVEETDLEDSVSDNEIEEVEVKNNDDDSSDYSSSDDETDSDFLDDDSVSISTESSASGDYEVDRDKDTVQGVNEEIPYLSDPAMPSHEVVFKYYLGNRPESCPEKIEVQDGDLNNNIALDNTLATRSVINLRWPFTSYYVKEFDLDSEAPTYEEDGLLPCYKSMKASASFPGRRRDVMLGRVWWVEWWAKDAVKDQEEGEGEGEEVDVHNDNPEKRKEDLEDVEEMGQFEREKIDTHL